MQAERDQPSSCPRDYSKRHRRHVHPVDHDHAASDHHQQALHGQRTQVQYPHTRQSPLPTFFPPQLCNQKRPDLKGSPIDIIPKREQILFHAFFDPRIYRNTNCTRVYSRWIT